MASFQFLENHSESTRDVGSPVFNKYLRWRFLHGSTVTTIVQLLRVVLEVSKPQTCPITCIGSLLTQVNVVLPRWLHGGADVTAGSAAHNGLFWRYDVIPSWLGGFFLRTILLFTVATHRMVLI